MYPLKLTPPLKHYLWGGDKLKTQFNIITDKNTVAESWELSCHKDGESIIENGMYSGKTLSSYIKAAGIDVLGTNCKDKSSFPVLIKLIDAKDNLSLQVHPDDQYAYQNEGEPGKTEMWYIIDCEENAELIYGFKNIISKAEFELSIENNTLLNVVNKVKVKKGDVFFIKSGTLHAIGKGIVLAEIQQNSNTTYRVYDYGRVDSNGNQRPLNIEKAIAVTDLLPSKSYPPEQFRQYTGYKTRQLVSCEYFKTYLYSVDTSCDIVSDSNSFNSIVVLEGNPVIKYNDGTLPLKKGNSVFIPASFGEYTISGQCEFILTIE